MNNTRIYIGKKSSPLRLSEMVDLLRGDAVSMAEVAEIESSLDAIDM